MAAKTLTQLQEQVERTRVKRDRSAVTLAESILNNAEPVEVAMNRGHYALVSKQLITDREALRAEEEMEAMGLGEAAGQAFDAEVLAFPTTWEVER